eukprot:TRINITY_DN3273_c0_g1_i1.p1 TRINITY_DN3273_c0_g1~~TRINITY_DN3273_c0_g1_i1.p1  ORF type:complete len:2422 (-),score=534.70 TRINITY_DN3273_c0_g1_i1:51-7103(-)
MEDVTLEGNLYAYRGVTFEDTQYFYKSAEKVVLCENNLDSNIEHVVSNENTHVWLVREGEFNIDVSNLLILVDKQDVTLKCGVGIENITVWCLLDCCNLDFEGSGFLFIGNFSFKDSFNSNIVIGWIQDSLFLLNTLNSEGENEYHVIFDKSTDTLEIFDNVNNMMMFISENGTYSGSIFLDFLLCLNNCEIIETDVITTESRLYLVNNFTSPSISFQNGLLLDNVLVNFGWLQGFDEREISLLVAMNDTQTMKVIPKTLVLLNGSHIFSELTVDASTLDLIYIGPGSSLVVSQFASLDTFVSYGEFEYTGEKANIQNAFALNGTTSFKIQDKISANHNYMALKNVVIHDAEYYHTYFEYLREIPAIFSCAFEDGGSVVQSSSYICIGKNFFYPMIVNVEYEFMKSKSAYTLTESESNSENSFSFILPSGIGTFVVSCTNDYEMSSYVNFNGNYPIPVIISVETTEMNTTNGKIRIHGENYSSNDNYGDVDVVFNDLSIISDCVISNELISCKNLPDGYGNVILYVIVGNQTSNRVEISYLPPVITTIDCGELSIYNIATHCFVTGYNFGPEGILSFSFLSDHAETKFTLISLCNTHYEIESTFDLIHFGGIFVIEVGGVSTYKTVLPKQPQVLSQTLTNTKTQSSVIVSFIDLFLVVDDVVIVIDGNCCGNMVITKSKHVTQSVKFDDIDCLGDVYVTFKTDFSSTIQITFKLEILWEDTTIKYIGNTVTNIPLFTFAFCFIESSYLSIGSSKTVIQTWNEFGCVVNMPVLSGEHPLAFYFDEKLLSTSPYTIEYYPPNIQTLDPDFVGCLIESNVSFIGVYFGPSGQVAELLLFDTDTSTLVTTYTGVVIRYDIVRIEMKGLEIDWCSNNLVFDSFLKINNVQSEYSTKISFINGVVYSPNSVKENQQFDLTVYLDESVSSFDFNIFNDTYHLTIVCYSQNVGTMYLCENVKTLSSGEYSTSIIVDEIKFSSRNFFVYNVKPCKTFIAVGNSISDVHVDCYFGNELITSKSEDNVVITMIGESYVYVNVIKPLVISQKSYCFLIGSDYEFCNFEVVSFDSLLIQKWTIKDNITNIVVQVSFNLLEIDMSRGYFELSYVNTANDASEESLCVVSGQNDLSCEFSPKENGTAKLTINSYFEIPEVTVIPSFYVGNIYVVSFEYILIDLPVVGEEIMFSILVNGANDAYSVIPSQISVDIIDIADIDVSIDCPLLVDRYACVFIPGNNETVTIEYDEILLGELTPFYAPEIHDCDPSSFSNLYSPIITCKCVSCNHIVALDTEIEDIQFEIEEIFDYSIKFVITLDKNDAVANITSITVRLTYDEGRVVESKTTFPNKYSFVSYSTPSVVLDSSTESITLHGEYYFENVKSVKCLYLGQFISNSLAYSNSKVICSPFGYIFSGNLLISLVVNDELSYVDFDVFSSADAQICNTDEFSNNILSFMQNEIDPHFYPHLTFTSSYSALESVEDRCNIQCLDSNCRVDIEPYSTVSIDFTLENKYAILVTISLLNPCCNLPSKIRIVSSHQGQESTVHEHLIINDFTSLTPIDMFMSDEKDIGIYAFLLDVETEPFDQFFFEIESNINFVNLTSVVFHGISENDAFYFKYSKPLNSIMTATSVVEISLGNIEVFNYVGRLISFEGYLSLVINDIFSFQTYSLNDVVFEVEVVDNFGSLTLHTENDVSIGLNDENGSITSSFISSSFKLMNGPAYTVTIDNDVENIIVFSDNTAQFKTNITKFNCLGDETHIISDVTILVDVVPTYISSFFTELVVNLANVSSLDVSPLISIDNAILLVPINVQCQIPSKLSVSFDSQMNFQSVLDLEVLLLNDNNEDVFGTHEILPKIEILETTGYFTLNERSLVFGRNVLKSIEFNLPPDCLLTFVVNIYHPLFTLQKEYVVSTNPCSFPTVYSNLENKCVCTQGYRTDSLSGECVSCGLGYYSSKINSDYCLTCPNDMTTLKYNATSIDACLCKNNFIFSNDSGLCEKCDAAIVCKNGSIIGPIDGYWMDMSMFKTTSKQKTDLLLSNAGTSNTVSIFKCLTNGCATNGCVEGYTGVLCHQCSEGYIQMLDFSCKARKFEISDCAIYALSLLVFIVINLRFGEEYKEKYVSYNKSLIVHNNFFPACYFVVLMTIATTNFIDYPLKMRYFALNLPEFFIHLNETFSILLGSFIIFVVYLFFFVFKRGNSQFVYLTSSTLILNHIFQIGVFNYVSNSEIVYLYFPNRQFNTPLILSILVVFYVFILLSQIQNFTNVKIALILGLTCIISNFSVFFKNYLFVAVVSQIFVTTCSYMFTGRQRWVISSIITISTACGFGLTLFFMYPQIIKMFIFLPFCTMLYSLFTFFMAPSKLRV